jgi:hypothetical protein
MATRTYERSCRGKQRHPTRAAAHAQLVHLVRTAGALYGRYQTYRCVWCDGWHIGHRSRYRGQVR